MTKKLWLLTVPQHRYGPGKIHALERQGVTFCGLQLGHGELRKGAYDEVTCKRCRPTSCHPTRQPA